MDDSIPQLRSFIGLETVEVQHLCLESGQLMSSDLLQWLARGGFTSHAILFLGAPRLGKTPLARSVCSLIARATQEGCPRPFFVQTSTLDSLRQVSMSLGTQVPLLLDDWSPEASTARRTSVDSLKHLLTTSARAQLDARMEDISVPPGPRVITSNCRTLGEWCHSLPLEILALSPAERLSLPPHALAVMKRLCFSFLSSRVVSSEDADRHLAAVAEDQAAKVRRLLDLES